MVGAARPSTRSVSAQGMKRARRWLWFVALWAAGVIAVAAGAWIIRLLLGI